MGGRFSGTAPCVTDVVFGLVLEQSVVLAVIYAIMFVVCFYDRFMGISKSRKAGKTINSSTDRRGTGGKIMLYFSLLFIATMIDIVQIMATTQWEYQMGINLPQVPLFTIVIAIWEGAVEWRSIYETFEDKERAKMEDTARMLVAIAKDKDIRALLNKVEQECEDNELANSDNIEYGEN